MDRYREWLRSKALPLYRHEAELDVDGLATEMGSRLSAELESSGDEADLAQRLYRVVATGTIELLRQAQSQTSEPPPGAPEMDAETLAKVDRVVATLEQEHQPSVRLSLQGFSRPEIEVLTGWNESDTRQRMHAALKELKQWLESVGIDYGAD